MTTTLLTTARRTAALLGPGWQASPDEHWPRAAVLTAPRPDGDPYQIRLSGEGKRLVVYGLTQTHGDYRLNYIDTPQISVTADMPARQPPRHLVSHLRRRFLPAYEAALTEVAETHARHFRETAERDAVADRLREAMPGAWAGAASTNERKTVHAPYQGPGEIGVSAEVAYDGAHVALELRNLTPGQAEEICRQLMPAQ